MKRAAEGFSGGGLACSQARQSAQEHVDLEDTAFICRTRLIRVAGIFREDVAPEVYQEKTRFDLLAFSIGLEFNRLVRGAEIDLDQLDTGQEFRAALPRHFLQLTGDRTHSTDGHFPFASLVADEVVKKTAVLHQRGIVRMRENADLGVRQDKATDEIVLQIALDGATERFLRQATPRFPRSIVISEALFEFFFCHQRFEHRIPGMFGEDARQIVKLLHLLVLGPVSGQLEHRLRAGFL